MKKSLWRVLLSTLMVLGGLSVAAAAENRCPFSPAECQELRADRREVRSDRRELRGDRRGIRHDSRELRSDVLNFVRIGGRVHRVRNCALIELRSDQIGVS